MNTATDADTLRCHPIEEVTSMAPHIAGYETVLSDAIDAAIEYCEDHASKGASATDLAYIYQTIQPGSDTGAAQDACSAMFWRLTYRRMIGAVTPLHGVDLGTVDIPEAFHPTH
jgi:hypothetical protein